MKFVPYILLLVALYGGFKFFKNDKKDTVKKVKIDTSSTVKNVAPQRQNPNAPIAPVNNLNSNPGVVPPVQLAHQATENFSNQPPEDTSQDNYPSEEYNSNPPDAIEPEYQQNDAPVEEYVPEENVNAQPSFENQPSPQFNPHTPQFNPDTQSFDNNN